MKPTKPEPNTLLMRKGHCTKKKPKKFQSMARKKENAHYHLFKLLWIYATARILENCQNFRNMTVIKYK